MKTVKKLTLTLALICLGALAAQAQKVKNHEFRLFYGTSYTANISDIFGAALANGILGYQNSKTTSFGMIGTGYRYNLNKFNVGVDLGFSTAKEELFKNKNDKTPAETYHLYRFLLIPTGEFSYYKNDFVRVYGSVGAGLMLTRKTGKDVKNFKPTTRSELAYQINPIGLRVGNKNFGAFVEAGYGYKGLLSAGLNFNF